jgi:hypothetical protein
LLWLLAISQKRWHQQAMQSCCATAIITLI